MKFIDEWCWDQNLVCLNTEDYINQTQNNLQVHCLRCGTLITTSGSYLHNRKGCHNCNRKIPHPSPSILQQHCQEHGLFCLNPDQYIKANLCNLSIYCYTCSQTYLIGWPSLYKNPSCLLCAGKRMNPYYIKQHCKSVQMFCHNPEDYINREVLNLKVTCKICNVTLEKSWASLKHGGCQSCKNTYTSSTVKQDAADKGLVCLNPLDVKGRMFKLRYKCNLCKREFKNYPKHVRRNSGCPTCNHGGYCEKYFDRNPEQGIRPAYCYRIKLTIDGQDYIKVGITINYKNRLSCFGRYDVKVLNIKPMLLYDAWKLEQRYFRRYALYQAIRHVEPFPNFAGYTECYIL